MKRILFIHTNFIPNFVVGRGIAMFTYLTSGTNRVLDPKYYSTKGSYSREMGVIYMNFTKALLHNRLNLNKDRFEKNAEIINFLEGFQGDKLFTRHYITKLKNQGEFERVPLTPKSKEFINYVKRTFYEFDEFEFTLVAPIVAGQNKETITNSKTKPIKIEPTIIETTPTIIGGTGKETITETITKIVEPVVTETITKVVEPVVKVVEPVVKVVETITKPVVDAIPNIVINNANSAQATTVTSNTQVASSRWDTLWSILGLKSIAKLINEIFGFNGDGMIFLLIQLPYLVWFLLSCNDNPEIMKYLTEYLDIEEYKAPNTELAPIEYDFEAPIDFDDDSNTIEADLYPTDQEEVYRDYSNKSDIEYFDYFDYYHSKPPSDESKLVFGDGQAIKDNDLDATTPTSKEIVEELKDMGNSLLDTTKDKVNTIVTAVAELEPIKDKSPTVEPRFVLGDGEVHVIDDQFSGAIDVFKEVQGTTDKVKLRKFNSNSYGTSFGGIIKWLFPMLDFDNLNYFPSLFENFSNSNNTYKIYNFNKETLLDIDASSNNNKEAKKLIKADLNTLALLEGSSSNSTRISKSLYSNLKFSDLFYFSEPVKPEPSKEVNINIVTDPLIDSNNSQPRTPLFLDKDLDGASFNSKKSHRNNFYNWLSNKIQDIFSNGRLEAQNKSDNRYISTLSLEIPSVNNRPVDPILYTPEEEWNFNNIATVTETPINLDPEIPDKNFSLTKKKESFPQLFAKADELFKTNKAIEDMSKQIIDMKSQFLDHNDKMNKLDTEILEFTSQKETLKQINFNTGKYSNVDQARLNVIKNKLKFLEDTKTKLSDNFNLNNNKIIELEEKKSALVKLSDQYKKELGNVVKTPV